MQFFDEGLDPSFWFVQTELLPVWSWGLWGEDITLYRENVLHSECYFPVEWFSVWVCVIHVELARTERVPGFVL